MKVVVIGDKETVTAYTLLGAIGIVVKNSEEMYQKLLEVAKREDIGLILLSESFSKKIRDEINDYRLKHPIPLILEIPSRLTKEKTYFDYKEVVMKSMGIKV